MRTHETKRISRNFYRASAADIIKIPGNPISYWLSEDLVNGFTNGRPLSEIGQVLVGIQTGDNEKFIRFWHEVPINQTRIEDDTGNWVPYVQRGEYRKWYGNRDFLLDWR